MTISSETRSTSPKLGNSVWTEIPFTFKVFATSDVVVLQTTDLGVETTLTEGAGNDYTVALNADQNTSPGGTITLTAVSTTDYLYVATSAVTNLQAVSITNLGAFLPSVLNTVFDKLTILVQQIVSKADRSLKIPLSDGSSSTTDLPTKANRADTVLAFDVNGDPIAALFTSYVASIDTVLTGLASGDTLQYDGANWVNKTRAQILDLVNDTTPQLGGALATNSFAINESEGAAVASATTTDIFGGNDGNTLHITGTAQIDDFTDASSVGQWRKIIFDGALTLTHGSGITLPGAANITTAAGDFAFVYADAVDAFRVAYFKADGTPVVTTPPGVVLLSTASASGSSSIDFTSGIDSAYDEYILEITDLAPATDNADIYLLTSTDGGSTYDSGGSDYGFVTYGSTTESTGAQIILGNGTGNAAGEVFSGQVRIYGAASSNNTIIIPSCVSLNTSGALQPGSTAYFAQRKSAADVDAIRIIMSTGNIASGEFKLYGVKKS